MVNCENLVIQLLNHHGESIVNTMVTNHGQQHQLWSIVVNHHYNGDYHGQLEYNG